MTNEVYANGREIACKAATGKVIACFPDTCLSPPSPPAGPVPIPYPNTASASDTSGGSTSVMISGQEVMLKDASTFKTSVGNEAATKSLGMGVVTHTIQGEASFVSWSMDVMIEGQNVDRHLDFMVDNEQCKAANTVTWPYTSKMTAAFQRGGKCAGMEHLRLQPYNKRCPRSRSGKKQTGHHLIPGRCMEGLPNYKHRHAPVLCVTGRTQHYAAHKRCHARFDPIELSKFNANQPFSYAQARNAAAASAGGGLNPPKSLTKKQKACVAFQMDQYYTAKPPAGMGMKSGDPVIASGGAGKVG